jgi:hypothetical protein
LSQQLVTILPQSFPHIWYFLLNDVDQQGRNLVKVSIVHVVVPRAYENAVVRLNNEVVADVVNYDCLVQRTAEQR